jgi:hypothetical protein
VRGAVVLTAGGGWVDDASDASDGSEKEDTRAGV